MDDSWLVKEREMAERGLKSPSTGGTGGLAFVTIDEESQAEEEADGFFTGLAGAANDFIQTYDDMKEANTIGADKYFHCLANCKAAKRGFGGFLGSAVLSDIREFYGRVKGDPPEDEAQDQKANRYGRVAGASSTTTCKEVCEVFRPEYLNKRW